MDDERIIEQGQHLSEELAEQRQRVGRKRFWCPVDLRARIVAYAVACSADRESHRRIAERLGMTQRTLSRWIRTWRQASAGVRAVAIVPDPQPFSQGIPLGQGEDLRGRDGKGQELVAALAAVIRSAGGADSSH